MRSLMAWYSAWRASETPMSGSGLLWMPNSVSQIGMRFAMAPARAARSSARVRRLSTPIVTSLGPGGRQLAALADAVVVAVEAQHTAQERQRRDRLAGAARRGLADEHLRAHARPGEPAQRR